MPGGRSVPQGPGGSTTCGREKIGRKFVLDKPGGKKLTLKRKTGRGGSPESVPATLRRGGPSSSLQASIFLAFFALSQVQKPSVERSGETTAASNNGTREFAGSIRGFGDIASCSPAPTPPRGWCPYATSPTPSPTLGPAPPAPVTSHRDGIT